jgi:chaperonin GroEL
MPLSSVKTFEDTNMPSLARDITKSEQMLAKLDAGVEKLYEVAKAAYGPGAGNVLLEMPYGPPQISRDGVNNIRKLYLKDPIENMAVQIVKQASEASNKSAGDGTSAAAIQSYHLWKKSRRLIGAGYHPMEVSRMLEKSAADVIDQIDKLSRKVTSDQQIRDVAIISANDVALGSMIADGITEVGGDGGIIVEAFEGIGVYSDVIEGFYYRKGFSHEQLINNPSARESRVEDADILITDKPLRTLGDIAPILDKIIKKAGVGCELVIIGDVEDEALAVIGETVSKGIIKVTLGNVPAFGQMRTLFLKDLATITGGAMVNSSTFELEMLGSAKRVIMNGYSTTIIGAEGAEEDKKTLIKDLKSQLKEAEAQVDKDVIRERLSRITGKVFNIHVGGSTPVERDEVKLRVDDAVCAVQSAMRNGIVPGGGIALARVTSELLGDVYQKPFMELVDNMGYNPERALFHMLESKDKWTGYDLRMKDFDYKPVDLLTAGVVDPTEVIKQVVLNSTSVVKQLITAGLSLTFNDREIKND